MTDTAGITPADHAPAHGLRARAAALVNGVPFTKFIIALILINACALGMETNDYLLATHPALFQIVDTAILAVFVTEMVLKLFAFRLSFFRSGWNVFDLMIISIGLIPAAGPVSVLRVFRVLRVLRLLSAVPQMRNVVTALLSAIPGMTSIVAVLGIVFYVAAVMTTRIFGTYPDPEMHRLFGTFGASMYTLFQVMTLEGWVDNVVNPVLKHFPWALTFFIPFIVITSFSVLNLFIGVIVDSMEAIRQEPQKAELDEVLHEVRALRAEIAELKNHRDAN